MAVLAALAESRALFMYLAYSCLLRLSTSASDTSRVCLRPVMGTVEVVPHADSMMAAANINEMNLTFFILYLNRNTYIIYYHKLNVRQS